MILEVVGKKDAAVLCSRKQLAVLQKTNKQRYVGLYFFASEKVQFILPLIHVFPGNVQRTGWCSHISPLFDMSMCQHTVQQSYNKAQILLIFSMLEKKTYFILDVEINS